MQLRLLKGFLQALASDRTFLRRHEPQAVTGKSRHPELHIATKSAIRVSIWKR